MKLFTVFQQGVYRQGCAGVFSSAGLAIKAAKDFALADRDSYHDYQVLPFELDLASPFENGTIVEAEEVYCINQKLARKS